MIRKDLVALKGKINKVFPNHSDSEESECTLGGKEDVAKSMRHTPSARQSACPLKLPKVARVCGTHALFYYGWMICT